ncbi:MAG: DoxX family protein [Pseudomonadota bacterium]
MIKPALRVILSVFYAYAGYRHLVAPGPFLSIVPQGVPFKEAVVFWTGIAEIAGALGLIQPFHRKLRQAAGIGLALYALCVWPANINHLIMDLESADGGLGLAYHIPRMIAQPIIIWLALWVSEVPLGKRAYR